MNKDEALKMAIEALESFEIVYGDTDLLMPHNFYKSLQACKEALEQPVEPQYINVYGYLENQNICFRQQIGMPYIGKIKLESNDD